MECNFNSEEHMGNVAIHACSVAENLGGGGGGGGGSSHPTLQGVSPPKIYILSLQLP